MIAFSKSHKQQYTVRKDSRGSLNESYVDKETLGDRLMNTAIKDGIEWDFMKRAYEINPWIRSIVDKTVERIVQVDIIPAPIDLGGGAPKGTSDIQKKKIEKIYKLFQQPNDQYETINSLRSKEAKDILIYDNANIEIVKKGSEKFYLYANAPGCEVYPNVNKKGGFKDISKAYVQIHGQKEVAVWGKDELMYFSKNKRAGSVRGFSPMESLALAIMGDLYSDKYNIDFFSNNARPNLIFLFKNLGFGQGDAALRRARLWYEQNFEGKPHKTMFMGAERGEVDVKPLQISNKDMEHKEYQMAMLSKIMAVFGMQPFVLGIITDTTGKLNSEEQTNQFKIDAVIPNLRVYLDQMNLVLIWNKDCFGYEDIYLIHDDLDLKDREKTAKMYETYLKTGVITINQVRQQLKMAPVPWGDVPYIPVNIAPLGGQSPDHMPTNPAASPEGQDQLDEDIESEIVNQKFAQNWRIPTGLDYVQDSALNSAISRILAARERALNIGYSFPKDM
jgi:HK97 family phage portal protein